MITPEREQSLQLFLKTLGLDAPLENINIALTHSSFCHENNFSYEICNERLEFLGDAVLKIAISDYLYKTFPHYNEGELSKIRSNVVSDETLNTIARTINLPQYLILGPAEEHNGGRWRSSTIACAFEAFLGALYLEGQYNQARLLVEKLFAQVIAEVNAKGDEINPKAMLQEYFQSISNNIPEYILTNQEGPPHNRTFFVDVLFEGEFLASGKGNTKKAAQKEAAFKACQKIGLIEKSENKNE